MSFDASRFDETLFCEAFGLHNDEVTVTDTGPNVTIRPDWTEHRLVDILGRFQAAGVRFGPCVSMTYANSEDVDFRIFDSESASWEIVP